MGDQGKGPKEIAKQKLRKKHLQMHYHEKAHAEQREKMQTAKGGYTDDIGDDSGIETLKPGWKDRTESMRARLTKSRAKAKSRSIWR